MRVSARAACVLAAAWTTACLPPVYVPPPINAPLLRRAHETTVAGHLGTGSDVQASHAVIEHLGIIATASYQKREIAQDQMRSGHGHLHGELGAGPLGSLGKTARAELFLGLGYGSSTGQVERPGTLEGTSVTGTYVAPFVQGDVGLVFRVVELVFAARVVDVHYRFRSLDGLPADARREAVFVQSAAGVRVGGEHFKLDVQLGANTRMTDESAPPFSVTSTSPLVSLGVFGRFGGAEPPQRAPRQPPRRRP